MSTKVGRPERAARRQEQRSRRLAIFRKIPPLVRAPMSGLAVMLGAGLALATIGLYFRTFHYRFVAYDDDTFVYGNPVVKAGLKASGLLWAFGLHFANWHPLTWFSYFLDAQVFGMNAGGFHLVNVLLHAGSVVLLFVALHEMTGRPWRCAVVAAVFALHPLHVESVAWIAERKDVLSTFFEMAALLLYVRYAERPTTRNYLLVFVSFSLGIMAKSMLVTFPAILFLLDCWPLRRISWPAHWVRDRRIIWEKLPFLVVSILVSALTMTAQTEYGTVASLSGTPWADRIATAAAAYVRYLQQTFWPVKLAVLYPLATPSKAFAAWSLVFLLLMTAAAVVLARRMPYLFTGWFWYLGVLVPVIGLVQVGVQSRADRYMYMPQVGIALAIVWAVADWVERRAVLRGICAVAAGGALVAMAIATWHQIGYWKDSRTLFEHALAVTERNYIMENNLGVEFARAGDDQHAMVHYMKAMLIRPSYAEAKGNMGNVFVRKGQMEAARPLLQEAISLRPDFPMALLDLGLVEVSTGDLQGSIAHLSEALRYSPDDPEIHSNLCYALEHAGRMGDALVQCREALRLRPDYPDAQFNLKNVLAGIKEPSPQRR